MSGPGKDTTIAARVPADLRRDLEECVGRLAVRGVHYPDGRPPDLSYVIRVACRLYANRELGRPELELVALDAEPRSRSRGPATSRRAARNAWPRARSQRRRALELIAEQGPVGMTGDELDRRLGGYNGRRRLSELKAGGWVRVKELGKRVEGRMVWTPERRATRLGAKADVYVLTPAAQRELAVEKVAA